MSKVCVTSRSEDNIVQARSKMKASLIDLGSREQPKGLGQVSRIRRRSKDGSGGVTSGEPGAAILPHQYMMTTNNKLRGKELRQGVRKSITKCSNSGLDVLGKSKVCCHFVNSSQCIGPQGRHEASERISVLPRLRGVCIEC